MLISPCTLPPWKFGFVKVVTAICSDRQCRKDTYGFARLGPQSDGPGISLWDVFPSPPSQLAAENRMCPKRHLPVEKPLFHLYKNPVLRWQNSRLWLQMNQRIPKFTVMSVWHECTCRAGRTGSSCIGLNQVFLLSSMDRLTVKNCHNLLFRQGSQNSL